MASFAVRSIDHVVLTVKSISASVSFYTQRLGMKHETFSSGGVERHSLKFGTQKINLHLSGKEFEPKAGKVQPGSGDLCFIIDHPIEDVLKSWQAASIEVLEGGQIVDRTGAVGKLRSVYCRDPDDNLIEVSNYV
ncbi:Glyoxalase/Bleomycin resistance protein/Dihydroxybiphenyl dioxygenase [Polychaeton citri CBS 116435]|uniref:Glyoxalase/Bleomycin resistance protein/Dihydroxybiphenyl dioxygenase n=1 Tax=Polychaeton citri CBS 116435 TaxID=1314669 RepID=A0A9P4QC85_9PEZI|nr:Glyoxalase/Bleomycin resistance protein/Dihydroxybiphenyl dioxygenase [Polychaeton citri CBS 116435]